MWSCARHVTIFTFKLSLQLFKKKKTKKKKKYKERPNHSHIRPPPKFKRGPLINFRIFKDQDNKIFSNASDPYWHTT